MDWAGLLFICTLVLWFVVWMMGRISPVMSPMHQVMLRDGIVDESLTVISIITLIGSGVCWLIGA